jgi:hypothetical protein
VALKGSEKMLYNIQNDETANLLDNALRHGLANAVVLNGDNNLVNTIYFFRLGGYAQRRAAMMADYYFFTIQYRFKGEGTPASGWYVVSHTLNELPGRQRH